MQRPQHRQRITGRARGPRRPHRVIHQPRQQPAQPRMHPVRPPGEPAQPLPHRRIRHPQLRRDPVPRPAPRRRQQPRPDHLHPVLPAPQHRIGQQHPRHPAPRAQRPPRPDPPDHPAQPHQVPVPPRTPTGPAAPRTPAPGTAAAPTRAAHRQPPRPDLPLAPGASERIGGPSGQAANLSRAGRSHSVVPTLTPPTTTPQAPPVMPAPPDAQRLMRAHSAWRVTTGSRSTTECPHEADHGACQLKLERS